MSTRIVHWLYLFAGGIGGGVVLAGALGLLGSWLGQESATGWGDLVGVALGLVLGAPLGIIVGIGVVAQWLGYRQTLRWIIPGVVISAGVLFLLAEPLHFNLTPALLWTVLIGGPALITALLVAAFAK
ncbi:MAG: hypothetical protein R3C14_11380 [Caldilineaceae bacterium]